MPHPKKLTPKQHDKAINQLREHLAPLPKMTPEKELEVSLNQRKTLFEQLSGTNERIAQLQFKIKEPILRKKYVGKYFKRQNSWGGRNGKIWYIYFTVISISAELHLVANCFESQDGGNHQFKEKDIMYPDPERDIPISKQAFRTAYLKFKSDLNDIYQVD